MSCLIPRLVATVYSFVNSMSNEECEFVGDDIYGKERIGMSCWD